MSVNFSSYTCAPAEPADATPGTPAITMTDIERFQPADPGAVSEPDGWGVRNMPVNFVLQAEPHVVSAELLGQPADVRFTPVAFRMVASDGGVVESTDQGATWAELGQDEFTVTPTSHVFTERGTHTITPTVLYSAEYRLAGGTWMPVPGVLGIEGAPEEIYIGVIETVLVPNPGERG
ncbi:hypothetical protein [Agromyces archimandritae]|uniref:Uncharacterized protein n=1 Tax=Agromyces archimandritae TaxID=2781962 RepID=A0A975FPW8_9MICO|nr:hypothetical protein [Agromyces archimandritae]QTX05642.1 hypothetical protein G127AT_05400 [Agromyces archimandritae]